MCAQACWDKNPGLRNEATMLTSSTKPQAQKALTGSVKTCPPNENSWFGKKKKRMNEKKKKKRCYSLVWIKS